MPGRRGLVTRVGFNAGMNEREKKQSRYVVRTLRSEDFGTVMGLERELFGDCSEGTLGAYYVRLCCDFFSDSCFLVEVEGRAVGYLLSFIRDRQAYCTTLAIAGEFQGSRVISRILRAFVGAVQDRVDLCWFTVEAENKAARSLHAMLGATEVGIREDFYGEGHPRIVSCIDRKAFDRLRARFQRLGLVSKTPAVREEPGFAGAAA